MIRYKKYQNQTKSTPLSGKWLARAVADETLDTRALAEHMAKHNTPYSQGAIHGVLKDMTSCIKELLLDGKNVKLDDLAIFGVGIRGKPADTSKDWSVTTNVVGLRLKCRATGTLAINQLKLEAQLKELSPYDIEGGNTLAAQIVLLCTEGAFTLRHRRWQYRRWRRGGTAGRTLSNRQEKPRETQTKSCVKNFS